ncbi:Ubiquitin-conjugating enzyme E2 15 [Elasticomyces elasticus]|nr:Ubiquitin-conjugating enzyme E2 15 [Elasticomyces elasticus]KAK3649548.1 Ubiquitin-conjugating enzyme E2 15 [Elasticomyces elasticus]KAK4933070.1 Ubiquitin-conjugating enzyme E2 15 [Elasticomyces elasticus]KAK5763969.1 Ubiquitin-conjugating enzyme E2 15 [Elasticomyces elasticus]
MAGRALSSSSGSSSSAAILLSKQFKQMQTVKDIPGISCGLPKHVTITEADMMLGGFFKAKLAFPPTYPHMPPSMTFTTPLFHPNIYPTGSVCISILHPPEDDKYGYESAAERWSPVQTPESILLSVISMLGSPNDESPANPEAGRLWREDKKEYRKRVRKCVRDSQESGEE